MSDKLIITPAKKEVSYAGTIRIDNESHKILTELSKETGLPFSTLANKMIKFASEHLEIQE